METLYLGQPFTSPNPEVMKWRHKAACHATAAIYKQGFDVRSPIVHYYYPSQLMGNTDDIAFWTERMLRWIDNSDAMLILMLPGWEESKGLHREIEYALDTLTPIWYIKPDILLNKGDFYGSITTVTSFYNGSSKGGRPTAISAIL